MKTIKTFNLLACTLLCLTLLLSCGKTKYEFMHPREDMVSVEIVEADYDYIQGIASQKTLVVINEYNNFINKLENIEYGRYLIGDPTGIDSKCIAVKITYKNGDYEVFDYGARSKYISGEFYDVYCGYGSFSKKEFYALLEEYIGYDATPR